MPKVTVCIPTHNSRSALPRVLEELGKQERVDYEVLLCDDGSDDGTWDYLQGLGQENVKVFRNDRNLNLPKTMKRLFDAASGEFIAIHHDHEYAKPEWLDKMLLLLATYPAAGMAIPAYDLIQSDGRLVRRPAVEEDRLFAKSDCMHGRGFIGILAKKVSTPVSAHGTVFRAAAVRAAGGYCHSWGLASDEDLYRRVASISDVVYCRDPVVTVVARAHERKRALGSYVGLYTLYEFRKDTIRRFWETAWVVRRWNLWRLSLLKARALMAESLSAWSRGAAEDLKLAQAWDSMPALPAGCSPLKPWGRRLLTLWIMALCLTLPVGRGLGRLRRRPKGKVP